MLLLVNAMAKCAQLRNAAASTCTPAAPLFRLSHRKVIARCNRMGKIKTLRTSTQADSPWPTRFAGTTRLPSNELPFFRGAWQ